MKTKLLIAACFVIAVIASVGVVHAASDKYDGDCTGSETAGRCADKCPDGYTLQGYDKDTGAAVCKAPPTGCPWGDSVPLGPDCDRLDPTQHTDSQANVTVPAPQEEAPAQPTFEGK